MEPLDLAGRGRRSDRREQVTDPALAADPVEQHLMSRAGGTPLNTRPLSVSTAWGTQWARSAWAKASQTRRAVARGIA
jgi:hypothetical protein